MKTCQDCSEVKPESEFYKTKQGYVFNYCRACSAVRARKWRENNREHHRNYNRLRWVTQKYKISVEKYEQMCLEGCAVCGSDEGLAVDHNHACCPGEYTCGECVRGLLCRRHNWAAGNLKDSPSEARKLAEYLERALAT